MSCPTYIPAAHRTAHTVPEVLLIWTCRPPTSDCSLQCNTAAHSGHIYGSANTTGLAKAKGAAACLVNESAQKIQWREDATALTGCAI